MNNTTPNYPFPRYSLVPPTSGMEQREDGEWVKLSNALRLLADRACLLSALSALLREIENGEGISGSAIENATVAEDTVRNNLLKYSEIAV